MKQIKKKKIVRSVTMILVTVGIFIVLFANINIRDVYTAFLSTKRWVLIILFCLVIPFFMFKSYRWYIILKSMGYHISLKNAIYITIAAFPFLAITPSNTGDLVKGYFLKNKIPATITFGSVITEKMLDLVSLCILVLIGLTFFYMNKVYLIMTLLVLTGLTGLFLSTKLNIKIPNEKWNEKFQNIVLSMKTIMKKPKTFFFLIMYSFLTWVAGIVQIYLFFIAFSVKVPLIAIIALMPIAILISQIPITLGGLGTRESAIIVLFSKYANASALLGVGILFSFFRCLLPALIGLLFVKGVNDL